MEETKWTDLFVLLGRKLNWQVYPHKMKENMLL